MSSPALDFSEIAAGAIDIAPILKALGNERRLEIVCRLLQGGEMPAGMLGEGSGLSQSALSQHLAKMREEGIVTFRRDSQTLWYRIADPRIAPLMAALHRLYSEREPPA